MIRHSKMLFVRKISSKVDKDIVDMIYEKVKSDSK